MIERDGYYYYLKNEEKVINTLKWSMAGGGVRILTDIDSSINKDELLEAFIKDCQADERRILPLSKTAQSFFEKHPEQQFILKSLDVEFLREHLK